MKYGGNETIHQTGQVNVEVNQNGEVVSVWFRCMPLPFTESVVDDRRSKEMHGMYAKSPAKSIVHIEFDDSNEKRRAFTETCKNL